MQQICVPLTSEEDRKLSSFVLSFISFCEKVLYDDDNDTVADTVKQHKEVFS